MGDTILQLLIQSLQKHLTQDIRVRRQYKKNDITIELADQLAIERGYELVLLYFEISTQYIEKFRP